MIGPITSRQTCTETTSTLCRSTDHVATQRYAFLLCIGVHLIGPGWEELGLEKECRAVGTHRRYRERKFAFGNQLLTFRTRASLTQSALAEQISVHLRS